MIAPSSQNRLVRIESKITRICHALGLDSDGNMEGSLALTLAEVDDILAVLEDTGEYGTMDWLLSKKEARWKKP